MKVIVDKDACIGCGMCIDICPDVFSYDNENKSVAIDDDIPEDFISATEESIEVCPVTAISTVSND